LKWRRRGCDALYSQLSAEQISRGKEGAEQKVKWEEEKGVNGAAGRELSSATITCTPADNKRREERK